jgi:hypothetical protein
MTDPLGVGIPREYPFLEGARLCNAEHALFSD